MNTATKKLLKLATKSATSSKPVFAPSIETTSLFTNSGLRVNQNAQPSELEVYFLGNVQDKTITPFPKLKPGKDLYFLVDITRDHINYKSNTTPASNQIGIVEITPETTKVNKNYTWEDVAVITVKSSKTTFQKEDNQFQGSYDWVIKRADGTEIYRESVTTVLSENKKYLNLSFDFANYPSGIYEFELNGGVVWKERFLVDKTGECKTGASIVIRIPYLNLLQAYTNEYEFDIDTGNFKNDDFTTCYVTLK